jgi:hypothetical protein
MSSGSCASLLARIVASTGPVLGRKILHLALPGPAVPMKNVLT